MRIKPHFFAVPKSFIISWWICFSTSYIIQPFGIAVGPQQPWPCFERWLNGSDGLAWLGSLSYIVPWHIGTLLMLECFFKNMHSIIAHFHNCFICLLYCYGIIWFIHCVRISGFTLSDIIRCVTCLCDFIHLFKMVWDIDDSAFWFIINR